MRINHPRLRSAANRFLAIERLSARLLLAADLQSQHYEDDGSLRYDSAGLAYLFDPPEYSEETTKDPGVNPGIPTRYDLSVPSYHSNASFPKKIYLDFDGQQISGTTWNNKVYNGTYNTGNIINAPAFSMDADLSNFSTTELSAIQEVWARVSEDYAAFQVDVTTELPSASAFTAGGQAIRVMFTTDVDATSNQQWYPTAGGVAYLNSWTWTNGSPVWVFSNHLGSSAKNFAEAAAHEVGHSYNLVHDGRISPAESYYTGHGSGATGWAPIMGVGYNKSLTQWSKGEYVSASSTQDDLAIINSSLSYISDDHAETVANATQLVVGTGGSVTNSGLISTRSDKDAFKFATQSGSVVLNVNPFDYSTGKANLDVQLQLLNAAGTVLTTINDVNVLNATYSATLAKGIYTLVVDGIGRAAITGDQGYSDYASIGKYSLSGTVRPNAAPVAVTDSATLTGEISKLIDVLANDTDANGDLLSILSFGTPTVGTLALESGKLRYTPPVGFFGQATFGYTVVDELGATALGSVNVNVNANTPPTVASDQASISGNEGTTITNTGTWTDPDVGQVVTLSASLGSIVKNTNGTWNWSIVGPDNLAATIVTITASDGVGGTASTTFSYAVNNLAPTVTRSLSAVSGNVLTTITNTGTYGDVPADTVTLTADAGAIVNNGNGTWSWSITPSAAISSQTVTVTATDEDGGSSFVNFTLDALVAIDNPQVFYKGSGFASVVGVSAALDSSKTLLKSSSTTQTTTSANVINYSLGLNGIMLNVAGLANTALTAADFTFRVAPTGAVGVVTPSAWAEPSSAPTAINVTAGTSTTAAQVRLEWSDNLIQNTWLQIIVKANANTGLINRQVFYIGHAMADVNLTSPYRVTGVDLSAVQGAINTALVPVTDPRDINKDRRVTGADLSFVQARIINTVLLSNITIPAAGSAEEGEDGMRPMNVMPPITSPISTPISTPSTNVAPSDPSSGLSGIGPRWTGLDYAVPNAVRIPEAVSYKMTYGPVQQSSTKSSQADQQFGLVDDFFTELGKFKVALDRGTAAKSQIPID